MPFRSENPIVRVEPSSMHTIDTRNAENLFGLWSGESLCCAARRTCELPTDGECSVLEMRRVDGGWQAIRKP